ncbi:hypothetical protein HOLleu_43483 [Holothuria leucospilota]|uniref:Uncharacterized protein n=1 Tax=Holothuria leucospilota TaxID=206669 RepID=A0A9Q1BBJ4_HOLLE|nr:hypothetical protein HOLleu_43483 [Holothuria leucospilota]
MGHSYTMYAEEVTFTIEDPFPFSYSSSTTNNCSNRLNKPINMTKSMQQLSSESR